MKTIQANGLKATELRIAILRLLAEKHGPFTAKEIQAEIGPIGDITNIYRCLEKFLEKGLVLQCDFNDGLTRFELAESDGSHHHHLVCTECRRWIKVDVCLFEASAKTLEKTGFAKITHKLEFFGLCPTCQ